jgi:hypothetical protein
LGDLGFVVRDDKGQVPFVLQYSLVAVQ